jgi:hypothetical protein
VICPKTWDEKITLDEMATIAKKNKYHLSADAVSYVAGSTYLHELMHLTGIIANPDGKLVFR